MLVYRISQTKYADDVTGEGARLFGGRWNLPMVGCLYTSQSRALAMLEFSANVSLYDIKRAMSFITYEIDEKAIFKVNLPDLPGNWRDSPVPHHTQEYGTNLLINRKKKIVQIPSVVVPDEFNFLINPLYYPNLKIVDIKDYAFDIRIKSV